MATAKPKKTKSKIPAFDAIEAVLALLPRPGRHPMSDIQDMLVELCQTHGCKMPSARTIGRRMAAASAGVARERVYTLGAA
jgi:hypothetical protein